MRDRLAWLLAVPLMLAGSFGGHDFGYRFAYADAGVREQALESSGHGYYAFAALAAGVAAAIVLVSLVVIGMRAARWGRHPVLPPLAFGALPPLAFVCQEHLERLLIQGEFPWTAVLEPSFLPGLLFQIPFAVAALVFARVLARIATRLGRALLPRPRVRLWASLPGILPATVVATRPLPALAGGSSERGPPVPR
jgi:hypothetical protein